MSTLEQWFSYISYCVGETLQAPVCRPFWGWVVALATACLALIATILAWKIVVYRIRLGAARRAEKERNRVDSDAIAARSWDGNKAYSASLGADEIERRVREAVDERRAANKPPSPIIIEK
jgi:flagellar biosynthesis/type III secretory pathway M-ring protein FliF/YscJ